MSFAAALLAALAIAPADRLALGDRLFNRGEYAAALVEYEAVSNAPALKAEDVLYRLAETQRALKRDEAALALYRRLFAEADASERVDRARLNYALLLPADARRAELRRLDADAVAADLRAAALYHLGELDADASAFERSVRLSPKGRYAPYAKIRRANLLSASSDEAVKRQAVTLYLEVAFEESGKLAEEALYSAAATSFASRKYGEALSLCRRYLKGYPAGAHKDQVTESAAWSAYLTGRASEAIEFCGEGRTDAIAAVRAFATELAGEAAEARRLLAGYLEDYPEGRHRAAAELSLSRLEFAAANDTGDAARTIEAARRAASLSGTAADRLRLAWAYERGRRTNDAVNAYLELAERFPGSSEAAEALYLKAMMDVRAERWSAAEVALKEALAGKLDDRRLGEAAFWRGVALVKLAHSAEAAECLQAALKQALPVDLAREARLELADIELKAGRREEAVEAYRALVREGAAERMGAQRVLAVGKLIAGEEAKLCARHLMGLGSCEWRQAGAALLGDLEAAEGHAAAAAAAYRKCLAEPCRTAPVAAAAVRLGVYLQETGAAAEAEKVLKEAIALNSHDADARAEAYLALARVAVQTGEREAAKGYLTVVKTLFERTPSSSAAKELLETLK